MGIYAVEWAPTPDADELLGRLGGVFCGRVMEFLPGREMFVADAWWLPPDGDPIGPMALEVSCRMSGPACRLHRQADGLRGHAALAPLLRRHRERLAIVARGAEGIRGERRVSPENNDHRFIKALGLRDVVLMNVVAVVGMRWIARGARTGPASVPLWMLAWIAFFVPLALAMSALARRYPDQGGVYVVGAARLRTGARVHLRLVPVGEQPVLLSVRAALRRGQSRRDGRPRVGGARRVALVFGRVRARGHLDRRRHQHHRAAAGEVAAERRQRSACGFRRGC